MSLLRKYRALWREYRAFYGENVGLFTERMLGSLREYRAFATRDGSIMGCNHVGILRRINESLGRI